MSLLILNKHFIMSFVYTNMKFIDNMIILHIQLKNNYNGQI